MPFARISLHRGKSVDYLQALSEGLHDALVESFEVPKTDRFQAIHQHEVGELIFDPTTWAGRAAMTLCSSRLPQAVLEVSRPSSVFTGIWLRNWGGRRA